MSFMIAALSQISERVGLSSTVLEDSQSLQTERLADWPSKVRNDRTAASVKIDRPEQI